MKIKTDFTTNSSSSSFVIAVKDNATVEQIKSCFSDGTISGFLDDALEFLYDLQDDPRFSEDVSMENKIASFKDVLAEEIMKYLKGEYARPMNINGWNIVAVEGSNEDGDALGTFLYDSGGVNSEIIKIKGFS